MVVLKLPLGHHRLVVGVEGEVEEGVPHLLAAAVAVAVVAAALHPLLAEEVEVEVEGLQHWDAGVRVVARVGGLARGGWEVVGDQAGLG